MTASSCDAASGANPSRAEAALPKANTIAAATARLNVRRFMVVLQRRICAPDGHNGRPTDLFPRRRPVPVEIPCSRSDIVHDKPDMASRFPGGPDRSNLTMFDVRKEFDKDFDPIAVVVDWLDACRKRDLAALLELYAGEASLECGCEGIAIRGRQALEGYWRPRLDVFAPTAFGLEEIEPA